MGYSITIGNAVVEAQWETEYDEPYAMWGVGTVGTYGTDDDPDGGNCNCRSPSYTGWAEFTRAIGLEAVFFSKEDGLMRAHPGTQPLKRTHLETFEAAQVAYAKQHPKEGPGLCRCKACCPYFPEDRQAMEHDPLLNYNLLRLAWLVKWTRLALTQERPAIENS